VDNRDPVGPVQSTHYGLRMRWERLFADLEAQLEAEERAAAEGEVVDLTRAERAHLALRDRLRAHVDVALRWSFTPGSVVEGTLVDVGADWVLVRVARAELLVPAEAVRFVEGLSRSAVEDGSQVARRWRFGLVLRGLARDRAVVEVRLRDGDAFIGTIDRVGADHLDLAIHPPDRPRREAAVITVRCIPLAAVGSVAVRQ
jgi:hypothetical protein